QLAATEAHALGARHSSGASCSERIAPLEWRAPSDDLGMTLLRNVDLALGGPALLVVVGPGELERAALIDLYEEGEIGVRRHRGLELRIEDRLAVVGDGERVHDQP